jgi:hypothetical protein
VLDIGSNSYLNGKVLDRNCLLELEKGLVAPYSGAVSSVGVVKVSTCSSGSLYRNSILSDSINERDPQHERRNHEVNFYGKRKLHDQQHISVNTLAILPLAT